MGHKNTRWLQFNPQSFSIAKYVALRIVVLFFWFWRFFTSNVILDDDGAITYRQLRIDGVFMHPRSGDSSFREDLRALAAGDVPLAQKEKERLEVLQRADKKKRKESGKGKH